jgi:EmrB/QacA subfamily drug resistance transporter
METTLSARTRWLALIVLCLSTLMIVLDSTIVNVALPSIRASLGFTGVSLAWVVNAYLLTFGGFLLLGGRLGDLYGQRRYFLIGLVIFTLASLSCGLATTQWFLITMRAIQGIGGAIVDAVALSLTMSLFTKPDERSRAMGVFGFVAAGGGSIGVLLGGLLTTVNWHWIFLVNIPIGIAVFFASLALLPSTRVELEHRHLDAGGATTVTAALIFANYAVVNGNTVGWLSAQTLGLLAVAIAFLCAFVIIESRVRAPLMPLRLFRLHNIVFANIIGTLWAAAMFSWFFISALYMQLVLGYSPLLVGLAFLPANLIMAVFSLWLSAKFVIRYGIKIPLVVGLGCAALGLAYLSRAPADGHFLLDILPSMILLGIGAGVAFNPVLLAAMSDVPEDESGLASGLVNTSFMMGGALALAILASIASARTTSLLTTGTTSVNALNGGYHVAFFVGGLFALAAAVIGGIFLRTPAEL